jgi:hypothetical protein
MTKELRMTNELDSREELIMKEQVDIREQVDIGNSSSKELVETQSATNSFAIFDKQVSEIREAIEANLKDFTASDFEHIKLPSGGGTLWTLPEIAGDTKVTEVEGILMGWRDTRAYWRVPRGESEGNLPPDCHSSDGRIGIGQPGGRCGPCQLADFGSGPRGAPACRLMKEVFLVRRPDVLPQVVDLAPTSHKALIKYLKRLAYAGVPSYGVVTTISLETAVNPRGIAYPRAVLTSAGRLTAEQTAHAHAYSDMLDKFLKASAAVHAPNDDLAETGEVI